MNERAGAVTVDRKGRCLVCGDPLVATVVWCTACATPHHRDCFAWAGHCALYGCASADYAEDPRGRSVTALTVLDAEGRPMPQLEFLDYTSEREANLGARTAASFAFLMLCAAVATSSGILFVTSIASGTYGLLAWLATGQINDYRIADRRHRILWNHKEYGRKKSVAMECTFEECRALVLVSRLARASGSGRSYLARRWIPCLATRAGRLIELSDGESVAVASADDLEVPPLVHRRAEYLATFFELPLEIEGDSPC